MPLWFDKGVGMTQNKKAARLVNGAALQEPFAVANSSIFNPDWRTKLASVNGRFRINGTYDHLATGRRLRRALERQMRKGGAA